MKLPALSLIFLFVTRVFATCSCDTVTLPVKLQVNTAPQQVAYDDGMGGTVWMDSAFITASINGTIASTGPTPTNYTLPSDIKTTPLEVGKVYQLTISADIGSESEVRVVPPKGFTTKIGTLIRNAVIGIPQGTYVYPVQVIRSSEPEQNEARNEELSDGDFSGPAGAASSLEGGRIFWQTALGYLRNGESAGSLTVVGGGREGWANFFTPTTLYYQSVTDDVYAHMVDGKIRQISAPQTFVDVQVLSATSYEIRFYHPSQAATGAYPRTPTGKPFVTYRIEQAAGYSHKLIITKETRGLTGTGDTDLTAPIQRIENTSIERSGQTPLFTWLTSDWTLASEPVAYAREERIWQDDGAGGYHEVTSLLAPNDQSVLETSKHQQWQPWGESTTTEIKGSDYVNSGPAVDERLLAEYTYYSDSAQTASYGFLRSSSHTGGTWEAYEYFDKVDDLNVGTIKRRYSPWLDAPTSVPATLNAAQGKVITYAYDYDAFGLLRRPKTLETRVNNVLVEKTTITYATSSANSQTLVTSTLKKFILPSTTAGLTTINKYYREDATSTFLRNQTHSDTEPGSIRNSYIRQLGNWDSTTKTFVRSASGQASRIGKIVGLASSASPQTKLTTYDTYDIDDLWVIPNKSTLSFTIRDAYARVVRTETHIWNGTSWQLVTWEDVFYNLNNQVTSKTASNGEIYEAGYSGELLVWERGPNGIKYIYSYDSAGRRQTATKTDSSDQPLLVTTYSYNAANQLLSEVVSVPANVTPASTETLTTSRTYDDAGRLLSITKPGATNATTYAYDPANRTVTETNPAGATRVQLSYPDGQSVSITGTAVISEYYFYTVNASNGQITTETRVGSSASPRWSKSTSDNLGRLVSLSRPAPPTTTSSGGTRHPDYTETRAYNATTGRLISLARSSLATTYYEYDLLGQVSRTGEDLNSSGTLTLASNDRIIDTDISFLNENSAWWRASTTKTYETLNSATPTTISVTKTRLSNFGYDSVNYPNLRSQSITVDVEGNATTSSTLVDRSSRTTAVKTRGPGLANDEVSTFVNGYLTSYQTADGLTRSTQYDALGRPSKTQEPRTAPAFTITTYWPGTTFAKDTTDTSGAKIADYGYDLAKGRLTSVSDANGKLTRYRYDTLGRVTHTWGPATTPAQVVYNAYGEREKLYTYQNGASLSDPDSAAWPTTSPSASPTTWTFDPASAVLLVKEDALLSKVGYTYDRVGRQLTRQWARHKDPSNTTKPSLDSVDRLTTTYAYATASTNLSGDLTSVSSNGIGSSLTTTVSYTYTRAGRTATVADATGTRTFTYDTAGAQPWRLAREQLPTSLASRVFTPLYENVTSSGTGTVKGRIRGFQLGTTSTPAAALEQTATVNNLGRLATIASLRDNNTPATAETFTYAYVANSSLVSGYTAAGAPGVGYGVARVFDSQRDLVESIDSKWASASLVRYEYAYNNLRQRTRSIQSGSVFGVYGVDPVRQEYAYNEDGSLASASTYLGATPGDTAHPLTGRLFAYTYDTAGNRLTANRTNNASLKENYTVDAANQLVAKENTGRSVSGTAPAGETVNVNGVAASRQAGYWERFLSPDNSIAPVANYTSLSFVGQPAQSHPFYLQTFNETLTYDADGNLRSDGQWTYEWDAENRLVRQTGQPWTAWVGGASRLRLTFTYDYLGRRHSKTAETQSAGSSTWALSKDLRFLYQGWNLVAEANASGVLLRSYTWGLDLLGSAGASGGVRALLQITDHATAQRHFPAYDGYGNVAALIRASDGALIARYEYTPFGELLPNHNPTAFGYPDENPFLFSTKYQDRETGLIYQGRTYYSAATGRLINRSAEGESRQLAPSLPRVSNLLAPFDYPAPAIKNRLSRFFNSEDYRVKRQRLLRGPIWASGSWGESPQQDGMGSRYQNWSNSVNACYGSCPPTIEGVSLTLKEQKQLEDALRAAGNQGNNSNPNVQNSGGSASSSSALGNALRQIPLIGGLLGGVGDIIAGVGNATLGIVSFGYTGSIGGGVSQIGAGFGGAVGGVFDLAGKAWNLPNTAIGIAWGLAGLATEIVIAPFTGWDFKITFGNNAIQFENHPLLAPGFMPAGLTLGNTISYSKGYGPEVVLNDGRSTTMAQHEIQHTYQGQVTGPAYIPLNVIGKISGLIFNQDTEGPANFMESGPYSNPPSPWPWR